MGMGLLRETLAMTFVNSGLTYGLKMFVSGDYVYEWDCFVVVPPPRNDVRIVIASPAKQSPVSKLCRDEAIPVSWHAAFCLGVPFFVIKLLRRRSCSPQ